MYRFFRNLVIIRLSFADFAHAIAPPIEDKFYIYDWPDVCAKLFCGSRMNSGAGRVLETSDGIYNTYQYALFDLMHSLALRDPRRTLNPEEATMFFIPYDSHVDAMTYVNSKGITEWSWDLGTADQAVKVHDLLQASPYFQRKEGKDHFMIIGWNAAMFFFVLKPQAIPLFRLCKNCTKLAIEDFSFLYDRSALSLPEEIEGYNW